MAVVERIEYTLTESILDNVVKEFVPEFVPKVEPRHDKEATLILLAAFASCLGLMIVGWGMEMPADHYVITGFGIAAVLLAASLPWIARRINGWVNRLTLAAQRRVRENLFNACEGAIGTTVQWEFDEEGFRTQMLDRSRRFEWSELKRIRILPSFWTLGAKRDELLLPSALITDPIRDLIRRKAAEVRAKFIERRTAA
jgi:hypothetical protein